MANLDQKLALILQERQARGLHRKLRFVPDGVLDIASNDYLGLANYPEVEVAARIALEDYGTGARASRLVSGNTALHEQLERELAVWKGCEAALVFSSGYAANLAVVPSLADRETLICCDKRNHASLIDACRLASANEAQLRYYHSPEKLQHLLSQSSCFKRRIIVSDAVYSMDGDLVDLPALLNIAREFDAILILDDAHGSGVLGETGRGAAEYFGLHPLAQKDVDVVQIGTLSKAFGSQGGFVAGSKILIEWLVNAARPFVYSTGLNPAACGAALAALRVIQAEPERRRRLPTVHHRLVFGLAELGFDAPQQPAPIIPIFLGEAEKAVAFSEKLLQEGVWCPAIRPPTVPVGSSRLRATARCNLSDEEINRVLRAFASVSKNLL